MSIASAPSKPKSLQDPALRELLQTLRRTDNVTNWFYVARAWVYLAAVLTATLWAFQELSALGVGWCAIPVAMLAIVLVGAGQHQLTALAHEASHHILFRNRWLNDLTSDWLCMFPMFSTTHHYRLQHLAHHQFVNDPDRDPDVSQLQTSGHWLPFPLARSQVLNVLWKQLWIPNLIKYIRVRARYNTMGTDKNPYLRHGTKPSRLPVRIGLLYLLAQAITLTTLVTWGDVMLLSVVPATLLAMVLTFYALIPSRLYHQSRVHSLYSSRTMTIMRMIFFTLVFNGLAWTTHLTGHWAALYFLLLWVVPMFTSFSFFMVLRQLVQHGNGDRGWLSNTRVFLVRDFIRHAVFPLGQDYHLPHHMYASVPHYRLRELHEALMEYPEYRNQVIVVEGYFNPPRYPASHPTVLDVLGPDYARRGREVFIDNSVLDGVQVDDKEELLRNGR